VPTLLDSLLIQPSQPYLLPLQQITPRTITTTARILVVHTVGRQSAIAQPAPNATKTRFLLTVFFIVSLSPVLLYTMKNRINRYSQLKVRFLFRRLPLQNYFQQSCSGQTGLRDLYPSYQDYKKLRYNEHR